MSPRFLWSIFPLNKNRLKQMFETVIMNYYYRGTTQIDDMNRPLFSCTNIHASWITGLVPGDAYY